METGIFTRYGLNMVLSRELGWTSVRDEMFYGDLDAAQSISGIAFALILGTPIGFFLGLSKNFTRAFDPSSRS